MKTYELALSSSNGEAAFSTAAEYGDGTHSLLNKAITEFMHRLKIYAAFDEDNILYF